MITVSLTGEKELLSRLSYLPRNLHVALFRKSEALVLRLQAHVQRDKLSGQVLNVVSGALRRSIHSKVEDTGNTITASVFSSGDVKYAGIHEYGGTTRAHVIEPKKAEALSFMMGGRRVFAKIVNHPGSRMPERSFLRSSLTDMRGQIIRGLSEVVREVPDGV